MWNSGVALLLLYAVASVLILHWHYHSAQHTAPSVNSVMPDFIWVEHLVIIEPFWLLNNDSIFNFFFVSHFLWYFPRLSAGFLNVPPQSNPSCSLEASTSWLAVFWPAFQKKAGRKKKWWQQSVMLEKLRGRRWRGRKGAAEWWWRRVGGSKVGNWKDRDEAADLIFPGDSCCTGIVF